MQKETVIDKCFLFLKELIPTLDKLPRSQKFFIGERMQSLIQTLMELLIEANYSKRPLKADLLKTANIKLEQFRFYMRLCYELGYFGSKKYRYLSQKVDEIGRMIGGWAKTIK